jgi:hypothetical protein
VAASHEQDVPNPDIEMLAGCARKLASMLGVPAPPDVEIRRTIREVLHDRGYAEAARVGIITRLEACNVLLAHLQSLVCAGAEMESEVAIPDRALTAEIEEAWFG